MTKKKRYLILMIFSALLNQILFTLAATFELPFWLDLPGTALAALILEPTAGLLVGFANNFYEAIYFRDSTAIIYYAVSAAVALIVGINMRVEGKIRWQRIFSTLVLIIFVTSFLSTLLLFLESNGVLIEKWEIFYYSIAIANGFPEILSVFFGIFVVKVYDTLASTLLIIAIFFLLPKKLRYSEEELSLPK
ncbi:MAG: hypothetical protein ACRCU3_06705 [Eubacteriaceae bacterium]